MTQTPAGSHLAPTDLPPPPPHADPREPAQPISRRGTRTPQRTRSPAPGHHHSGGSASRGASPTRRASDRPLSGMGHGGGSGAETDKARDGGHASAVSSPLLGGSTTIASLGKPIAGGGGTSSPPALPHHSSSSPTHANFAQGSGSLLGATGGMPHLSRPGSPASMHSSTSAIFERDIEVPAVHALSLGPAGGHGHSHPGSASDKSLSHRPSRLNLAHGSALDHTVPAVLDDAVEALGIGQEGVSRDIDGLEIESPAPAGSSGVGLGGIGGGGSAMARQASPSVFGLPRKGIAGAGSPLLGALGVGSRSSSPATSLSPSGRSTGVASPVSIGAPALAPGGAGLGMGGIGQPGHSPPILAQLSTHGAGPAAPTRSSNPTSPIEQLTKEMNEVKKEQEEQDALGHSGVAAGGADEASVPKPFRPPPVQRMSTGKQVPGGWLSAWNEDVPAGGADSDNVGGDDGANAPIASDGASGNTDIHFPPAPPAPTAGAAPSNLAPRSPLSTTTTSAPISPTGLGFGHPQSHPQPQAHAHLSHLSPAKDKRRISFVSPTDLLLSVPTQVTSLGEITSGNAAPEHFALPGTISPARHVSQAGQGQAMGGSPRMGAATLGADGHGHAHPHGEGHGEWEREGLGRGLEQRLEGLAVRQ